MNFGQAIELLKRGSNVARAGWNGKGMYLTLTAGAKPDTYPSDFNGVSNSLFEWSGRGTSVRMPCITMKAADGSFVPGWLASQTDMLAEDWVEA